MRRRSPLTVAGAATAWGVGPLPCSLFIRFLCRNLDGRLYGPLNIGVKAEIGLASPDTQVFWPKAATIVAACPPNSRASPVRSVRTRNGGQRAAVHERQQQSCWKVGI